MENLSEHKTRIHQQTRNLVGYAQWLAFNREQNAFYQLGLDERSLKVMSLLDSELSKAQRWRGSIYMAEAKADSTASHSKQVMLLVQEMFERSLGEGPLPDATEQLRKDALMGA